MFDRMFENTKLLRTFFIQKECGKYRPTCLRPSAVPPAPPAPRWSPLVPPEVFERRETGGGAARPSDSPPKKKSKKLASGSALYQQLQIAEMEAAAELEAVRRVRHRLRRMH